MPNGKPFTKNDPRINKTGRPHKRTFSEIMEAEFGGKLFDSDGRPIQFDEMTAKKLTKIAFEENNPGLLKFIYKMATDDDKPDPELAGVKLATERARAEKLEIANQKARGELINRELVKRTFGKVYAIDRAIFLAIGPTAAGTIAAKAGIKNDALVLEIEEIITKSIYQGLAAEKREINDFLIAIGGEPMDDKITDTPARKRQKK
jgi:hypothetical protein